MITKATHISICGIGPGNPDYISKAVFKQVAKADVLIGGKRQLSIFSESDKVSCVFDGKTANLKSSIERHVGKYIVVLVSGDIGFHSLRRFLLKTFPKTSIELIPGISSFQYFYARLGLGYENALLTSIHGTESDYIDKMNKYSSVFLLTDRKSNYKTIARNLVQNGFGHLKMHVGNNLSYSDEQIISFQADKAQNYNYDFLLCSVIIENQDFDERF
jgi:cobalt-precorrin-7 (C5)-methyltransferase